MTFLASRLAGKSARLVAALLLVVCATPALAQNVVIFDGFGDADINNDGVIDDLDVNVAGAGTDLTPGPDNTYVPGRLESAFDAGDATLINPELDAATVTGDPGYSAGDTGIRWLQMRGFTGGDPGDGASKPTLRVVDDTDGSMQETSPGGAFDVPAIDDGFAMSWESRGGGSSAAGFFDQTIELGPEVGDEVKVSFDFRLWRDAPNVNSGTSGDNVPTAAELRFGLFQDTDNQLGLENPVAGRLEDTDMDGNLDFTGAVWGQEEGAFDGILTGFSGGAVADDVGSNGDNGWTASAFFGDSLLPNGGGTRIREELQSDRILQGNDTHTIAQPENLNEDPFGVPIYDFVTLDNDGVYTFALSLVRDTVETPGDTITATFTIFDKLTGTLLGTLSGTEGLEDATSGGVPIPGTGGVQSDSWDYFALRNASNSASEYDFLLDNFTLEVNGSNAMADPLLGDADGDGDVDGDDLIAVQTEFGNTGPTPLLGDADGDGDVDGDDLIAVQTEFGNVAPATAVPEPGAAALIALGAACLFGGRRRV